MTSEYAWRYDKGPSGPVSKGTGRSTGGKGYNPYRAGDGKFAPGAHKERPKVERTAGAAAGPAAKDRASAKAKAPARVKFNAEPHKQLIAGHKAVEAHHRGESLRLAGEMKALKEKAKATKPRSAERAALKAQHAALKTQRDEHKTKATAARTERIAASKGMQAARKEHAAGQRGEAAKVPDARPAAPAKISAESPAPSSPMKTESSSVVHNAKPVDDATLAKARAAFSKTTTPEEFAAVSDYRGMFFGTINRTLRGTPKESDVGSRALVEHDTKLLDSAIAKNRISEPVITYRGVESHPSFAGMKPGDTYTDHGYISTTTDPSAAMGGSHIFHITSPAGTKLAAITADSGGFTGAWGHEKEMVMARGSTMRLDRIETTMNRDHPDPRHHYEQTVFHMTVVGQP